MTKTLIDNTQRVLEAKIPESRPGLSAEEEQEPVWVPLSH
jgi:hypothetical protein